MNDSRSSEARARGRCEQPFQCLELLAPAQRALEIGGFRPRRHLVDDAIDRLQRPTLAEARRGLDAIAIGRLGDEPGAGAEARLEVVPRTRGPSWLSEEVALLGVVHRHVGAAIAEAEQVGQRPRRDHRARRRWQRPIGSSAKPVGSAGGHQPGSGLVGQHEEAISLRPVHRHVERRPVLADELEFRERRGEFTRGVVEHDVAGGVQDPGLLVVGILGAEIRQQPGAHGLCLAGIEYMAAGVDHAVGARPVLSQALDPESQGGQIGGREGEGEHEWKCKGRDERREKSIELSRLSSLVSPCFYV